jgi:hypothetical protein
MLPHYNPNLLYLNQSCPNRHTALLPVTPPQDYVDLNQEDSYLRSAGAAALVSSKAGRAAKVGPQGVAVADMGQLFLQSNPPADMCSKRRQH